MGKVSENKINFTKSTLLDLPAPARQTYYWDTKIEGLGLGVTPTGTKTFILYRRLNGKPVRLKLGRFPVMTVEQARTAAISRHAEINQGGDPRTATLERRQARLTMGEVYKDYLAVKPNLSAGTLRIYEQNKRNSFSDWWEKPLSDITDSMVQARHRRDGQKSQARANQSMRMLRALFNFARHNYRDSRNQSLYPHNPVEILSGLKSWYRVRRRTTVIKQHQLKPVFRAIMATRTERVEPCTFRDYLRKAWIFRLTPGNCWSTIKSPPTTCPAATWSPIWSACAAPLKRFVTLFWRRRNSTAQQRRNRLRRRGAC